MGKRQVNRYRSRDQYPSKVKTTEQTMQGRIMLTQPGRELHGAYGQSCGACDPMKKDLPSNRVEELPCARLVVKEESFVMVENKKRHEAKNNEQHVLRSNATLDPQWWSRS
jgi:hypothetical protein